MQMPSQQNHLLFIATKQITPSLMCSLFMSVIQMCDLFVKPGKVRHQLNRSPDWPFGLLRIEVGLLREETLVVSAAVMLLAMIS